MHTEHQNTLNAIRFFFSVIRAFFTTGLKKQGDHNSSNYFHHNYPLHSCEENKNIRRIKSGY